MNNLAGKCLIDIFIGSLGDEVLIGGNDKNPFKIKFNNKELLIFIKNMSPTYFKRSPDTTRIQLPYSEHFNEKGDESLTILTFGYDSKNKVFVTWDYKKLKTRINNKKNVSLYSRLSLQEKAIEGEVSHGTLKNGEEFIVFKKSFLPVFLSNLNNYFTDKSHGSNSFSIKVKQNEKLTKITNVNVKSRLKPILEKNKVFEAATLCYNHYGIEYPAMTIINWLKIVVAMHETLGKLPTKI